MSEKEINWPLALRATESGDYSASVSALRDMLLRGLRAGLSSRNDISEAQLEDFAQESLLRVLDRVDQFQGRSSFSTWAYAIAMNTAFTELRRKRWQDVSLDAMLAQGDQMAESAAMPDNIMGGDEARTRFSGKLDKRFVVWVEQNRFPTVGEKPLLGARANSI